MLNQLRSRIAEAKERIGDTHFPWYPYDTFANVCFIEHVTGSELTSFVSEICPKKRILDVGCGDGELSFLLEALGFHVTAIDHPSYNHNGMQGIRALRSALGSSIEIHEVDLDRQFTLPSASYDLILFLGVLYHLRNPFFVLEELAKRAHHCLLSTRIASHLPTGSPLEKEAPLAYLLDNGELNDDDSNYFIFSEPALKVLLHRTFWKVANAWHTGDKLQSDPIKTDARVYLQLESVFARTQGVKLTKGWHEPEGTGWRWTAKTFSIEVSSAGVSTRRLTMRVYVPHEYNSNLNALRITILVDGVSLAPAIFEKYGLQVIERTVSFSGTVHFTFSLDRAIPADRLDPRERGIIIQDIDVN